MRNLRFCLVAALAILSARGQDLKQFEKNVTEFTLANGLHFIVLERHAAPVVAFHTCVNAGSVDDPSGETGMAHMFERIAFKGTETIGTADWPNEKKALDEVEDFYNRLEAERSKGPKASQTAIGALQAQAKMAIDRAEAFAQPDEYERIVEENGGAGLNAHAGQDVTDYSYSLPSNRIELWFLLESQRFLHPVFREFYKERDAAMEENRQRVESSPRGKLLQELRAAAFEAHPYRNPRGGWPSDILNLHRDDARRFFEEYYVPANMAIAIVGDVDPADARRMAERYFGPLPARPLPPLPHTQEPAHSGQKTMLVESPGQPLLVFGYKRPDQYDKDDPVFDIAATILSSGLTSWLYKDLVQEKRIALSAEAIAAYPGRRYPNLFVFFDAPAQGHGVEENQKALDELVERLKSQKVDAQTLERAKAQARAGLLRRLDDNTALAATLTSYYANYGDWRKVFTELDDRQKVTAEDVQRVARKYFTPENRTVAYTTQPATARQPAAGGRP